MVGGICAAAAVLGLDVVFRCPSAPHSQHPTAKRNGDAARAVGPAVLWVFKHSDRAAPLHTRGRARAQRFDTRSIVRTNLERDQGWASLS